MGVVAAICGVWAIEVFIGAASDGATVAVWFALAGMMGAGILRLMRVEGRGAMRVVTAVALGLGVFSLYALGMGVVGWLNRWTAIALAPMSIAVWGMGVFSSARLQGGVLKHILQCARESADEWLGAPARWGWLWLVAVPFLAVALVGASMMPGSLWKAAVGAPWVASDPHPYDVMTYHLQVPREWYEAGRITSLPHNVYSFFPFGMEMQYLLAMYVRGGPWAAMYLSQFLSLGCMVLAVVGVYAAAKEATKDEGAGTVAGVIAATVPWTAMLGSVAYIESGMLLYSVAALGWIIRAVVDGSDRIRALGVAGIMAGFACGTKYTAVPTVLVMFPAAAMTVMALCRVGGAHPTFSQARRILLACVVSGLAGLVVFSPWLIRDLAWTGNPVFPMEQRLLGQAHFDDVQTHRWDTAHATPAEYHSAWARIKRFSSVIVGDWQFGWIIIPAATAVMAIWIRRPAVGLLAILFVGQIAFWLIFTHLQPSISERIP